jgi:hypothetical protein
MPSMTDNAEWDELFTPQEAEKVRCEWGTTNALAVQQALSECDLRFLARHLREAATPGRAVCEALADLIDPPYPLPPDQKWRLCPKRAGRGRPQLPLDGQQRKIILDYHKEEKKQRAMRKSPRGVQKLVTGIIAERHGVDEKTVRNLLNRLQFRD